MNVKFIKDEDFINYKFPTMFIGTCKCTFKCCKEAQLPISTCQNEPLLLSDTKNINDNKIIEGYLSNPITSAICFGGLEPFEQFDEIVYFIRKLRLDYHCNDTVIIYTGYTKEEKLEEVKTLKELTNIIVKFGRFKPNSCIIFDDVLGVWLASDNQAAEYL